MPPLAPTGSDRRLIRPKTAALPSKAATLFAQALNHHQQGRVAKAIRLYNRIIDLRPDFAECHSNLGAALNTNEKFEQAEKVCRRAIALKVNFVEAHCNLGVALVGLNKLDDAVSEFRTAIRLNPGFHLAHTNLGDTLRLIGDLSGSEAASRTAVALCPTSVQAPVALGNALRGLGRLDEAETMLRRATQLAPSEASAFASLGIILMELCRPGEAEAALLQAIALRPTSAEPYNNLALLLKELGRLSEASQAAEQAIKLRPRKPLHFLNLGETRRYVYGDRYLTALEALAKDKASLSVDEQIYLHFALAKAYADVGRTADEFHQLLEGNALKRSRIAYNEAATLGRLDRVQAVFMPELISTADPVCELSPVPIFIVGMQRSGTTLVEQILASHPQVFGAGELKLFDRLTATVRSVRPSAPEFPDLALHMSHDEFRRLGQDYLSGIKRLAPSSSHVTDKMPANFVYLGLIHLALPSAIIIHTVRDPVDNCMSCFSKLFSEPQSHTYDLAELGRYYRRYEALMAHWSRVLPPGRILDVRYEDVVANLEGEARRIIDHCRLPWDSRCLDFHRTERLVRTASAAQVRQPIYTTSIGRHHGHEAGIAPLLAELSDAAPPLRVAS